MRRRDAAAGTGNQGERVMRVAPITVYVDRGCRRVWLSTDPANPAVNAWPRYGFAALGVKRDFKGPGKDRALFERRLA